MSSALLADIVPVPCQNQFIVVRLSPTDKLRSFRVIAVGDRGTSVALFPLHWDEYAMPGPVLTKDEVCTLISRGDMLLDEHDEFLCEEELPPEMSEATARDLAHRRRLVKAFDDSRLRRFAFEPSERAAVIEELATLSDYHPSTVRRLLCAYLRGGMSVATLLPEHTEKGAPGVSHLPNGTQLGRPRLDGLKYRNSTLADRADIAAMTQHIVIEHGGSIEDVVQRWFEERSSYEIVIQGKVDHKSLLPENRLSDAAVESWARKYAAQPGKQEEKKGPIPWAKRHRSAVRRGNQTDSYAGLCYEIDETPYPAIVISEFDESVEYGLPTTYATADTYAHTVTGKFATLGTPSAFSVAQTVYNAAMPKKGQGKALGLDADPDGWCSEGLPLRLRGDGALLAKLVGQWADTMHMEIEVAPSWRPDRKPVIERILGLLQAPIKELERARQRNHPSRRQYRDPPRLTLKELNILLMLTAAYENCRPIPFEFLDPEYLKDGLRVPLRWEYEQWSRATLGWPQPTRTPSWLRWNLLPYGLASVGDRGINVEGVRWEPESPLLAHFLNRKTNYKRPKIWVRRNEDLVRDTWAWEPQTKSRVRLRPLGVFAALADSSWSEVRALTRILRLKAKETLTRSREYHAGIHALAPSKKRMRTKRLMEGDTGLQVFVDHREEILADADEYEEQRPAMEELIQGSAFAAWCSVTGE